MTSTHRDGTFNIKVQVWFDRVLYDQAKELIETGAYLSMAELVRDGAQMAIDKNSGYLDTVNEEIVSKYREDELMATRIKIDGTLIGIKLNARWFAKYGAYKLIPLIDDLAIPGPISAIEEKYGTTIELYDLNQPEDGVVDDGYKETHAYKYEHGLLDT